MRLNKSIFADILIIIFCTAGSVLCVFFFWGDLNITLYRLDEQPVGTITFRYNTAQRRFVDRVIWDRLRNESPVYNGDFIRTANMSEASITFVHGDVVDLLSNTLIQIFADTEGSIVDFSGGGINVNTVSGSGMVILSGDRHLAVDSGAAVRLTTLTEGSLDLDVMEGTAVFENAGEALVIEAGSGVFLNAAGETQPVPRAVAVSPSAGARFLNQSVQALPVDFIWNKVNYAVDTHTRLEVASDRSFNSIRFAEATSADRFDVALPEGIWFWRLYPVAGEAQRQSEEIPYSRITVVHSPLPRLISPAERQVFNYRSRFPSVRFVWASSPDVSQYILEVANNPSITNPTLTLQVRSGAGDQASVVSSALGEGTWYWRVTPVYSRNAVVNISTSNEVRSFVIERDAVALPAPVLTAPADGALINIETGRRDILFSWQKRGNETISYTLRISANSNMSSPVIEQTITDTFFRYGANETAISAGTWYWTVHQTGQDGTVSPPSQTRTFNALRGEVVQRLLFPPDSYTIADNLLPDMRFTYRTNLENTRFQISTNSNFSSLVVDEPSASEAYTVRSLQSGNYYWRIVSGTGAQQRGSPGHRLTVADPLPPPLLQRPVCGIFVAHDDGRLVIRQGYPVQFNWTPQSDAHYYSFKLYRGGNMQTPILETVLTTPGFSLNMDNYAEGAYTWTVQAFLRESALSSRRTGLSASHVLGVWHLRPVQLEQPHSGVVYTALDASRRPAMARWSSREAPANVRFVLARDINMTDIVFERASVPNEFTLPRLSDGDYYWAIQAQTVDGYDISSPTPFHFQVLPFPPLPTPRNRLPADRHTITPQHVRTSRSLDFSWSRVEGANGYMVTVYRGERRNRVTVLQSPVITGTKFTVEDIRTLGRGNLFWYVEALYVLEDGHIEQRSRPEELRLNIDIPIPQKIETRDSGTLYGS
ncbi:MAG: hypothetical protein LBU88_03810 [Treponema sp.]|jgi:hypothetical protein|nr:hypothetical protein [Treponema sp.]